MIIRNILKYTIGLPYLISHILISIFCWLFDELESIIIEGKNGLSPLNRLVAKEITFEIWRPIK